jgi:hypothetical protein
VPTVSRNIGLTSQHIVSPREKDDLIDITVQNLSANNVYVLSAQNQTLSDGIRIKPNCTYANDKRHSSIWLVAHAASSDVKVHYELYKAGSRHKRIRGEAHVLWSSKKKR